MNEMIFTQTANAGLSVTVNNTRIWIDALPGISDAGYSTVSDQLWAQMIGEDTVKNPDLLVFTHCHPDHYSEDLVKKALSQYPGVPLVMPEMHFGQQTLLTGRQVRSSFKGLSLTFLHLPHEGAQYRDVPHYALLIRSGRQVILAAGDTETASEPLGQYLTENGIRVDTAVLPFPWMTLRRGRAFIEDVLQPSHLLINHIPFPEDDKNGYLEAVRRARPLTAHYPDVRFMTRPLQTETVPLLP